MEEPTEKQIKEFWEWCGFRHNVPSPKLAKRKDIPHPGRFLKEQWYIHSGFADVKEDYCGGRPPIDLNNLFKYAVPKVHNFETVTFYLATKGRWGCYFEGQHFKGSYIDYTVGGTSALALFWTIYKMIENGD